MKKLLFLCFYTIPAFIYSDRDQKGLSLLSKIDNNASIVLRQAIIKLKKEEKEFKEKINQALKAIPTNSTHPGLFLEKQFGKQKLVQFKEQLPTLNDFQFFIQSHKIKIQDDNYLQVNLSNMYLSSLDGLDELIQEWIEMNHTAIENRKVKDIQLILDNAVVGKISTDTFTNFPLPVTELEKEFITIGTLEPYAFKGLDTLTEWYWWGANIHLIKSKAFSGLKNMELLVFDNSKIKYIEEGAFDVIPEVIIE